MLRIHRILIVYAVAIPLALILGYLVAIPDRTSIAVLGMVLFVLILPLLLRYSYWLMIFFWNSAFIAGILPGDFPIWIIFAALTFFIALMDRVMGHRNFLRAPELTKPLLFLTAVVIFTAKMRGGLGLHALGGSSYGGKHYLLVLGAIMGYFALTSQPISPLKSARAIKCFYLSGLTYGLTNLAFALGPMMYFVYYFVSVGSANTQASAEYGNAVERFGGLGPVANTLFCFVLAQWGIRGGIEWSKPWRGLLLLTALLAGVYSGYRSLFIFLVMLLVVQFMIEGLWKTAFLPAFMLLGVVCLVPMLLFADKMPGAVQRTLSFLPVDINPDVRSEAETSSQWRFDMWGVVLPMVPQYLLVGKGYSIDPTDLFLNGEAARAGYLPSYSMSATAGDYHSGGLSLLIPFGAFGTAAFLWVLGAGIKVLYLNRRYGDPRLKSFNNLFLAFFITQSVFYFLVFGAFDSQLYTFLGVLGMSVSLNGGVRRKEAAKTAPVPTSSNMLLEPA